MIFSRLTASISLVVICIAFQSSRASDIPATAEVNDLLAFAFLEISSPDKTRKTDLALESFEIAAKKGSEIAIHALGLLHLEGIGVEINREKAFSFFSKGAVKDYPPSQNQLGAMYNSGFLHPRRTFFNYKKAVILFEKAAKENYGPAQYNLANAYRTGRGKAKDLTLARAWFEKAANKEIPEAQYFLAVSYELGVPEGRSIDRAKHWFCRAANLNLMQAQIILDQRYGGLKRCPNGNKTKKVRVESRIVATLRDQQKEKNRNSAAAAREILTKTPQHRQESRGEELLGDSLRGLGAFFLQVVVDALAGAATEVLVYKILDLEPGEMSHSYYQPSYSDQGRIIKERERRPIYGSGRSINTGSCQCQCVNGQAMALCKDGYSVAPMCVGVCPPAPGSARPPSFGAPSPPGTSQCRNEQIYDYTTRQYKWKRLCI